MINDRDTQSFPMEVSLVCAPSDPVRCESGKEWPLDPVFTLPEGLLVRQRS